MSPVKPDLSVLDLAPVPTGTLASEALRRSVALARHAERLGYVRHWFAEHHGMPSVASSAPEILIAHVASATDRIRVGSGGVMLPNHVPLKVAEAFHTLHALHPGRIDLGIGRAPGSDPKVTRTLRAFDGGQFPALLAELLTLSRGDAQPGHPLHGVRVMPDDVPLPPIWLLGSSGASAAMAGEAGMGYSFASHFSHTPATPALRAYRDHFQPSADFPRPHAILCVAAVCAETSERADFLAGTLDLMWLRLHRGEFLPLPSPEEAQAYAYTEAERSQVAHYRELTVVGTPETVCREILRRAEDAQADEIMLTCNLHDHDARLHSYTLIAEGCACA